MRRIRREKHPSYAKRRCTPLLHAIWADIRNVIVARFRVPRENFFVSYWLSLDVFFAGEAGSIAVGDAVKTVLCDSGEHVEVLGVDYEVGVGIVEFVGAEVYLCIMRLGARQVLGQERHTLVATSCAFNVSPGYSGPNNSRRTVLLAPSQPRTYSASNLRIPLGVSHSTHASSSLCPTLTTLCDHLTLAVGCRCKCA